MTLFYEKNGIKLYYEIHGQEESQNKIVILPGWGNHRETFYPLINKLMPIGTIYIIDLLGFGNSPFPQKTLTIYDYTLLIKEWMEYLNIDSPTIICHSFGGRLGILLSGYYHVPTRQLVLIDSAGIKPKKTIFKKLKTMWYRILKGLGNLLPKKIKTRYRAYLFSRFASKDYQNLKENERETFKNIVNEDLSYYLEDISVPTLILWGEKDIDTPIQDGKTMESKIEDAALISFSRGTHFSYLEYKEQINNIIYTFVKEKEND